MVVEDSSGPQLAQPFVMLGTASWNERSTSPSKDSGTSYDANSIHSFPSSIHGAISTRHHRQRLENLKPFDYLFQFLNPDPDPYLILPQSSFRDALKVVQLNQFLPTGLEERFF